MSNYSDFNSFMSMINNCKSENEIKNLFNSSKILLELKKIPKEIIDENNFFVNSFCRFGFLNVNSEIFKKFLTTSKETLLLSIGGVTAIGYRVIENDSNKTFKKALIGSGEPLVLENGSEVYYLSKENSGNLLFVCEFNDYSNNFLIKEVLLEEKVKVENELSSLNEYYFQYDKRYQKVYQEGAYLWEIDTPNEFLVKFLEEYSREEVGNKVIDLGCGEGRDSCYLASRGFDVLGVDVSVTAIEKAMEVARSKNVNPKFLIRDVFYLRNLPDIHYDLAINMGCLHMIDNKDQREMHIKRVFDILKPGGYFLVAHCRSNWGEGFFSMPHWESVGKIVPGEVMERRIRTADGKEKFVKLDIFPYYEANEENLVSEITKSGFFLEKAFNEKTYAFGNTAIVLFRKPKN